MNEEGLRRALADRLVQQGFIQSSRVSEAFFRIPRSEFVPEVTLEEAYSEEAIVTRRGPDGLPVSSSGMPGIMAVMAEQLDVRPGHRVLEIGAGTGYNAAILAHLAGPDGQVTTVDIDEEIVQQAREHLKHAGHPNVAVIARDGWQGAPEHAPFDRIEVTVGVWDLSPQWVDQLAEDGIMVVPLWLRAGVQASITFRKKAQDALESISVRPCGFMRLRGPHAGPEAYVIVDGWQASLDRVEPGAVDTLRELLTETPRSEPAPALRKGAIAQFALSEPKAISLTDRENWRRVAWGVFDPDHRSLAIVIDDVLWTYGTDPGRIILLRRLKEAEEVRRGSLVYRAYPAGSFQSAQSHGWTFARKYFTFVVSTREDL